MPSTARTVGELGLPVLDYADPELRGERFHRVMRELAAQGWLAAAPFGYVVLDREAAAFFLRTRSATFPGRRLAELFGIEEGPPVEEVLRFEPITPFTARIVVEELDHRGVTFPEGTVVMVSSFTANRDLGAGGGEPEAFDITADRGRTRPLTFGRGDPPLPRREPGPCGARRGPGVPRPAHARTRARRRAGLRNGQRDLRP